VPLLVLLPPSMCVRRVIPYQLWLLLREPVVTAALLHMRSLYCPAALRRASGRRPPAGSHACSGRLRDAVHCTSTPRRPASACSDR
jgi:hypothetical protein